MSRELGWVSVTTKTKLAPSGPVAFATPSTGGSSLSAIVPVATPSASVAPRTSVSASVTVSSGSSTASSTNASSTRFDVSPGANVSSPESAPR